MAHEILNGKPYTYLDDAPLEERRTRAVTLRRALPENARELGALDPDAIERVRDEAWPAAPRRRRGARRAPQPRRRSAATTPRPGAPGSMSWSPPAAPPNLTR